ncbi:MAG: hypothetical protein ABI741_05490 [Ferruginibacter sp.]
MKIEQLIVQQLYSSKKVTLQDIGTFILSPSVVIPFENDKESAMPENAVSFEFNKKAPQDEDLVSFIVSQTRKIRPLASSDLESYSILAKQFLNIGKPFPIEGLGVLQKTQAGDYEFIQGNSINAKLDAAPALLKEKSEEEISFSTPPREVAGKKWIWILLLFLVTATAATVYYFLKKDNKDTQTEKPVMVITDTIVKPKDTTARSTVVVPDTTAAVSTVPTNDGYTFKIVIREFTNKDAAEKFFSKYTNWGYKFLLYTKDSVTYKIAIPFTRPLSDTLNTKDSLQRFYNVKTYVETN